MNEFRMMIIMSILLTMQLVRFFHTFNKKPTSLSSKVTSTRIFFQLVFEEDDLLTLKKKISKPLQFFSIIAGCWTYWLLVSPGPKWEGLWLRADDNLARLDKEKYLLQQLDHAIVWGQSFAMSHLGFWRLESPISFHTFTLTPLLHLLCCSSFVYDKFENYAKTDALLRELLLLLLFTVIKFNLSFSRLLSRPANNFAFHILFGKRLPSERPQHTEEIMKVLAYNNFRNLIYIS